jgi:hypothetical protein
MMPKTVLVKQGSTIDLEFTDFKLEEGKTYYDDGTTVFDVYIHAGIEDGSMVAAVRRSDTIVVTARRR